MAGDVGTGGAGTGGTGGIGGTGGAGRGVGGGARRVGQTARRLSTETKASFKTSEFFAYLAVLAGVLIAGAVIDETDAGGYGARQVWVYATILTVGYMISRGLAKSGSREPYWEDGGNENRGDRR